MSSLHGDEHVASANGVTTQHLGVTDEATTTDSVWPEAYEREVALRAGQAGAVYGHLHRDLTFDTDLSPALRLTLLAMTHFVDDDGESLSISQYTLAKRLGITRQTLSEHFAKAVQAGLLQRQVIDGEVHWRMRWLVPPRRLKRQAVPDAQRQALPDSQALPDAPHAHAHALSPVLKDNVVVEVKDGKARKPKTEPLTDEQRATLHQKYESFYPSRQALDDVIDSALEHENARKWKTEYRYAMGWVQRDIKDRKIFNTNLKAAEARLAKAKGEPTHNPLVSEPSPWFTRDARDIEPFVDRTKL